MTRFTDAGPHSRLISELPLRFEPVEGATGRFIARGNGYALDVQAREHTLTGIGPRGPISLRTRFPDARSEARAEPSGLLPSHTNYFSGRSPSGWRTNVPNFAGVRISGLFEGIDLAFRGGTGALEYDFILHPGADPSAIRFIIDGAHRMRVDERGDLILTQNRVNIRWKAPVIYQMKNGGRRVIAGSFDLDKRRHSVSFAVGRYDRARELVIDPTLSYASYLGGSGKELARGIGTDSAGNVYVAGGTTSTNLGATPGAQQTALAGPPDAYVAKFSATGTLIYTTFLGGRLIDYATALAVDASGNAYVTGMTNSPDFPTTSRAFQRSFAGAGGNTCQQGGDAFVAKLNPSGSQLLYSTYLGGRRDDIATGIAIDLTGNAYIGGSTLSTDFPTTAGAYQTNFKGFGGQIGKPICNNLPWFNSGDAFIAKLDPSGAQLAFSTYLGGSQDDAALAIAVDASGNVYIGGFTISPDLPVTPGALGSSYRGADVQNVFFKVGDGFVGKLSSSGSQLIYLTYLGGSGDDAVTALYPLSDGSVWVTGSSSSMDFPVTPNAVQKTYAGYQTLPLVIEHSTGDAIVAHINPTGTSLAYSTYFGGAQNDMATSIGVDATGLVYMAGFTDSSQRFPLTQNALQPAMGGTGGSNRYFNYGDGFIAVIDPAASRIVYSSYFGGSMDDEFLGLALDGKGGIWVTGNTLSPNLNVTASAAQKTYGGQRDPTPGLYGDAVLVQFTGLAAAVPAITAIQNAASSAGGAVSAGMIFTLYGSGLGPQPLAGASLDASGKLATTQAGVTITFDGHAAPIVYVSGTQSAGVAPYEIANQTSTSVVVENNGQRSAAFNVPVLAAIPGLFSANFSGSGPAVAFNQDGSLNSAQNPAAKGSVIVLFGTGEGQTNPPGVTGFIAIPGTLPSPAAGCSATVGGLPGVVQYCGAVPFVVTGEFQLNVQMSPDVASGSQPVVVKIGQAQSQANLTVFVQ